jgi:putative SOS response-associated peptidase YedK
MMRWGFPPPPNLGNALMCAIWNPLLAGLALKAEWRCLVPATSFCEWTDSRPKVTHWFVLEESRPLLAFAGIWRFWTGERKRETGVTAYLANGGALEHAQEMAAHETTKLCDRTKERLTLDEVVRIRL